MKGILNYLKNNRSTIIVGLFIGGVFFYLSRQEEGLDKLTSVNPLLLVVIAASQFMGFVMNAVITQRLMAHFKKPISFHTSLTATIIASIGNFFLPVGSGTGLKAAYLKRKADFQYSKFLALTSVMFILMFIVGTTAGLISLFDLKENLPGEVMVPMTTVFFGVFAVSLTILLVRINLNSRWFLWFKDHNQRAIKFLARAIEGTERVSRDYRLLGELTILVIINFAFVVLVNWAAFAAVDENLSFMVALLFAAINSLTIILNITPGSVGFKEAIYFSTAPAAGFGLSVILAASVVDRVVRIILLAVSSAFLKDTLVTTRKNSDVKAAE
ncbi:MAG: lysylphosphatidylglycerol synthase transmembrane domain-containing protein [Candidatus Saccharimonadales bacterium]|nr:lysylphosphatidylglycerol synthase transmembrane domain-containing protein [Candidatus Saccharimonadales bacterium]